MSIDISRVQNKSRGCIQNLYTCMYMYRSFLHIPFESTPTLYIVSVQRCSYSTIVLLIGNLSMPGSTGTEGNGCCWTASQSSSYSRGTWSREGKAAERSTGATAAGLWTAGVCKSQLVVVVPELSRPSCNPADFSFLLTSFSAEIYSNFCCLGKL